MAENPLRGCGLGLDAVGCGHGPTLFSGGDGRDLRSSRIGGHQRPSWRVGATPDMTRAALVWVSGARASVPLSQVATSDSRCSSIIVRPPLQAKLVIQAVHRPPGLLAAPPAPGSAARPRCPEGLRGHQRWLRRVGPAGSASRSPLGARPIGAGTHARAGRGPQGPRTYQGRPAPGLTPSRSPSTTCATRQALTSRRYAQPSNRAGSRSLRRYFQMSMNACWVASSAASDRAGCPVRSGRSVGDS
jgi:hypothetical protein